LPDTPKGEKRFDFRGAARELDNKNGAQSLNRAPI
jgi:hypothetical protein